MGSSIMRSMKSSFNREHNEDKQEVERLVVAEKNKNFKLVKIN